MSRDRRAAVRQLVADGAIAARIATAWLASLLPRRTWRPITRALAALALRLRPGWTASEVADLDRLLGAGEVDARRRIVADRIAYGHESRLHGLREYWPGQPRHRIRIIGDEHLRTGLAGGNGVILWVGRFAFASLIAKVGLHQAGYTVSHLSRPAHGFATSPRAIRWLNPIWTGIEERYVRERIVLLPGRETAALRALRSRLTDNQVVSITVGDEGSRIVAVDLFEGKLRLATGAISLAAATNAALIPVFAVRDTKDTFTVELQAPLEVPGEGDREERFRSVAGQYAHRLARVVTRYPGQWLG